MLTSSWGLDITWRNWLLWRVDCMALCPVKVSPFSNSKPRPPQPSLPDLQEFPKLELTALTGKSSLTCRARLIHKLSQLQPRHQIMKAIMYKNTDLYFTFSFPPPPFLSMFKFGLSSLCVFIFVKNYYISVTNISYQYQTLHTSLRLY